MKEDEWSTGLSKEVWDARPEDSKEMAKERIHKRKRGHFEWTNRVGDKFREGDEVIIKKHTSEFSEQGPTYTSEMAERYEGTEQVIDRIMDKDDVCLKDEGFTWHLDWLEPVLAPLEDELFEI